MTWTLIVVCVGVFIVGYWVGALLSRPSVMPYYIAHLLEDLRALEIRLRAGIAVQGGQVTVARAIVVIREFYR